MPPAGFRSPDRKLYRLSIPISVDLREQLRLYAIKRNTNVADVARVIIIKALNEAGTDG
jgi:hypothetical protein